jgi:DNA-binding CsgD family transcriptional regulator
MQLIEEHPERVGYLLKRTRLRRRGPDRRAPPPRQRRNHCLPHDRRPPFSRKRRASPLDQLTEREREVLALVAEGLSNRAIATRLFVTERKVEAQVNQIFQSSASAPGPAPTARVLAVFAHQAEP